jgi:hypothetical protein
VSLRDAGDLKNRFSSDEVKAARTGR